jgi:hypothetical protein
MIEEHNLTERARDVFFYAKHYPSPDKPRRLKISCWRYCWSTPNSLKGFWQPSRTK